MIAIIKHCPLAVPASTSTATYVCECDLSRRCKRAHHTACRRIGNAVTYRRAGKLYYAEVGPSGRLIKRRQVQP